MAEDIVNEPTVYRNLNKAFATRTVRDHAPHLIAYLEPTFKILDVGCGVGSITLDLARRVPHGHVVGMDINHSSIEIAQAAAKEAGLTNIDFEVCSVADLARYETDWFDVVHAHQVMLHLPKPVDILKEMHRVTKPGGIVGIRDLAQMIIFGAGEAMAEGYVKFKQLSDQRGSDIEGGRRNHIWMHETGFSWKKWSLAVLHGSGLGLRDDGFGPRGTWMVRRAS